MMTMVVLMMVVLMLWSLKYDDNDADGDDEGEDDDEGNDDDLMVAVDVLLPQVSVLLLQLLQLVCHPVLARMMIRTTRVITAMMVVMRVMILILQVWPMCDIIIIIAIIENYDENHRHLDPGSLRLHLLRIGKPLLPLRFYLSLQAGRANSN